MPIDLKEFRQNLLYTTQAPLTNILDDIQKLAEIDTWAENNQKKYGKQALAYFWGLLFCLLLFIVRLIIAIPDLILTIITIVLIIITPALLIALIYALVKRSQFDNLNISNYKYNLTKKVLQMLARDMEKPAMFDVKLSFLPTEHKDHKIATNPHPHKSGWKVDIYRSEWSNIKGHFLEKTRFNLSLTQLFKKEYGWKRGSSGKQKYKSKGKNLGLDIELVLTYPQRRYGAIQILENEVASAVKLPDSSTLRGLKVSDKSIRINVRMSPPVAESQPEIYKAITSIFLSCYQVLNLAKVLSK